MQELRETSPATARLLLEHVAQQLGAAAVERVVAQSGVVLTPDQLTDPAQWISYDSRVRLFEAAAAALGHERALFDVGASALRAGTRNPGMVAVLRALGSPRQVFTHLPRAVAKFSTTSTMTVLDAGRTHATISYVLHEGYRHSRLDCLYAQGLFSVVPEIFGLPPARVVHEECESDGAPACVYHVTWRRYSRWRRRAAVDPELELLRQQLDGLHAVAADLVSSDQVEDVLQRITERAAWAVLAPGHVLAVHRPGGGAPLVLSAGVPRDDAERLAARLLAGEALGAEAVVVDVASTRWHHGRLAALHPPGQRGLVDEQRMLASYARHAAVALDLLVALEASRREAERATALLALSGRLATADGTAAVADVVAAALRTVVGCEQSSVLLWHPAEAVLRAAACTGLDPAATAVLLDTALQPEDVPELVEMLARRQPMLLSAADAGPVLSDLLTAVGAATVLVAPLRAGDDLLGVITAGWPSGSGPGDGVVERTARLAGVADQAATALLNARLVETVTHQSLHDDLTGLPNRVLFGDRLDAALLRCLPRSGVAVLFCDLDRFKQVNDALGHAAGDELLRQTADRLRASVRPTDVVARLSGDEFAVLLTGVDRLATARDVAERLVRCFEEAFRVDGRELRVTTSVGVAMHTGPGGRGDRLLRAADAAMYRAKQRGRNQISCAGDSPAPAETASLEQELAEALGADQLRLHVQPVVDVSGPHPVVAGLEALVRWEHPRLGLLAPAAFLPMAEESGLVVALDLWAVDAACAGLDRWSTWLGRPLEVAVNLSSRTLADPRLVEQVRGALASYDVPVGGLSLEVVESRTLTDLPAVADRLRELRHMGVRTALDDFGTGYSTLSWLQDLPVDRVKLDRGFTAGLPDRTAARLVRGVVALADELEVEVVAEGVETREQLDALREAGCRLVQGYLFGRPGPCPAAPALLPAPRRHLVRAG